MTATLIETEDDTFVYSDRHIAELLPTIWNLEAKLNPSVKHRDPEMPKGPAPDPSHAGDHMAHCADIDRAFRLANLTLRQKQILLLRYGMNWEQKDVAEHFGNTKQSVSESEAAAIKNISTFLNGSHREENVDL